MNFDFEELKQCLKNSDDSTYNTLLLRLYDEYEKNYNTYDYKELTYNEITILDIKKAYNNIISNINHNNINEDKINNYIIMLENNVNNFNLSNKKSKEKIIDLITKLEALLKIKLTFPENIEKCLIQEINKQKKHTK